VKDRVFSGADVEEAKASAAANLGLPLASLRFVVLDAGAPGGRGLSPTPARIAVLLEDAPRSRPGQKAPRGPQPERAPAEAPPDPRAGLVATIGAVAEAGGLRVSAELEEGEDALVVTLRGEDRAFFLEPDDRAEVLRATEHLLLRLYGAALQPRTVRLTGEGFRERRDAALAAEARRLAGEVRADGRARTMPPLNSYERRVVHLALQGEPGVATHSAGEGAERRLTIAPAAGGPEGDAPGQ
jgi:predicted RNA-binding protein Jag